MAMSGIDQGFLAVRIQGWYSDLFRAAIERYEIILTSRYRSKESP